MEEYIDTFSPEQEELKAKILAYAHLVGMKSFTQTYITAHDDSFFENPEELLFFESKERREQLEKKLQDMLQATYERFFTENMPHMSPEVVANAVANGHMDSSVMEEFKKLIQ